MTDPTDPADPPVEVKVEVEAWAGLAAPERRHDRVRRVGIVLGGAATAVLLLAAGLVAQARLRHLLRRPPVVFTGQVTRPGGQAGARAVPAGDVDVDVYLDPAPGGQPVAWARATTDGHGGFTLRADPPSDLARFTDGNGQIEVTVVYQDQQSSASAGQAEELAWRGASQGWRLLRADGDPGSTSGPAQVALVVQPTDVTFEGCHPDTQLMLDWMRAQVDQELAQARRDGTCP